MHLNVSINYRVFTVILRNIKAVYFGYLHAFIATLYGSKYMVGVFFSGFQSRGGKHITNQEGQKKTPKKQGGNPHIRLGKTANLQGGVGR